MNFILYKYYWKQIHHPPEHIISFIPQPAEISYEKYLHPPEKKLSSTG